MTTATKRKIPADAWDALEFSALVNGGIGRERMWDYDASGQAIPRCLLGHIEFVAGLGKPWPDEFYGLSRCGYLDEENDKAVRAINERLGNPDTNARVPFDLYVEEMGWERGE